MTRWFFAAGVAVGVVSLSLLGVSHSFAGDGLGTVSDQSKISATEGGFSGQLEHGDRFGAALANAGEINGDGRTDLLVGAPGDDAGGGAGDRGAVWILFSDGNGGVLGEQKISAVDGGFFGLLRDGDAFGSSVTTVGDLDGDRQTELAIGAIGNDDGAQNAGAVWTVFLNSDGSVRTQQKISSGVGGFPPLLDREDRFGASIARIGDLDGDLVEDLVVGAPGDDDGGVDRGAIWILFLNTNGTVKAHQKISSTAGEFGGLLGDGCGFGESVVSVGDMDGNGVADLAVGASQDDDGGTNRGAVWILFLEATGTVKQFQKISSTEGQFGGALPDGGRFGGSVASLGDLNSDSVKDLVVGADRDPDGGTNRGACWILFLNSDGRVNGEQKISSLDGGFFGALDDGDFFGRGLAVTKSTSAGGATEIWVGARGDDDGGGDRGAVWALRLVGSSVAAVEDPLDSFRNQRLSPNPARSETEIVLRMTRPSHVEVSVMDAVGRSISSLQSGTLAAGTHRITWDLSDRFGSRVPSGVYFVRTRAGGEEWVQRISVLR